MLSNWADDNPAQVSCPAWTLDLASTMEGVSAKIVNSLDHDITASFEATCSYDACSNMDALRLGDIEHDAF